MQNKTMQNKFERDLLKVGAILKARNIAILESHVHPDFAEIRQVYGEATFIPLNKDVLEDIVTYINQEARKLPSSMALRVVDDETNNRYTIVIAPNSDTIKPSQGEYTKPHLLQETEKFMAHMAPAIKHYQMRFGR
jgi:hypothetical protein